VETGIIAGHRNGARRVFRPANCAARGAQTAAERVAIAILKMVGFGVGISRGADVLKITLGQRRLVLRKRFR
jgi:hypothetical protein